MRVLVADDSRRVREHLVEMIKEIPGVEEVVDVANGWDAVARVLESSIDVMVLDLRMPLGNGLEVLEGIKAFLDRITVIVVTAYAFPQYRERSFQAGASYFFDKGKEIEKIREVIAALVAQKNNISGRGLDEGSLAEGD